MSERYTRRLVRLPQRMVTSFVTCMDCGSHVLDREAHDNWHAALTPMTPAVRAGDQEEKYG